MKKRLWVALAMACVSGAGAKTCTWTAATGGDWTDAANWADGNVPENGDDVVFGTESSTTGGEVVLGGQSTAALASLTFPSTAGVDWNIQNGTLLLRAKDDGTVPVKNLKGTVRVSAVLASDGDVNLVKQGNGTLSLSGTNTFTGRLVIEGGRLQPECDEAFGPAPAVYRADAIILRNGATLSTGETFGMTNRIVSTRGITLDGAGELGPRSLGTLIVQSPIVGTGDLYIALQTGETRLAAVNAYTGRTALCHREVYYSDSRSVLNLDVSGALPATTVLVGSENSAYMARINLAEGTAQTVAGVDPQMRLEFCGAGVVRFAADDTGGVTLSDVRLYDGARLSYAGSGTLVPDTGNSAATGTVFAVERGTLAPTRPDSCGRATLGLGAGTALRLPEGMAALTNDLELAGAATLVATGPALSLVGGLRQTGAGALTVSGPTAVTFGIEDDSIHELQAPITGADVSVTLDGWVRPAFDPSVCARTAACVVFGPYAGVTTGTVLADGVNVGVDDLVQTGPAAQVTVRNGGRFVYVSQTASAPVYAFDVDASSAVVIGGTEAVDLTGATFAGTGQVLLRGPQVTLKGDLSALKLNAAVGEVYVPENETLTVGVVEEGLRKTGPGALVYAGEADGSGWLEVLEGTVRLASTAPASAVADVRVAAGARLVLDADEQIRNDCRLFLNGTFDLNGHTETLQRVLNTPESTDALRDVPTGAVVNTSSDPAQVKTSNENPFYGSVSEAPGAITWSSGNAGLTSFFGPAGSAAPSTVEVSGNAVYFSYTRWNCVMFVFHRPRQKGQRISLSEIQLTCGGVPLPQSVYRSVAGNGAVSDGGYANLYDGKALTAWTSDRTERAVITITFGDYAKIDGYRLGAAAAAAAPLDWDVYVRRADPSGWMLVDSRRNEKIVTPKNDSDLWLGNFSRQNSANYTFSAATRPGEQLTPDAHVKLNRSGKGMRVCSTGELRVGKVSGVGDVCIENGSSFSPGDTADWTGAYQFTGTGSRAGMGRILLDAEKGGAEQTVRFGATNSNVSVENAGTTPVALLVDDMSPETPAHLRLADGHGPMGLVKRGSGVRTLGIEESANTGATVVESGCLRVAGPYGARLPVSARYLRIWPTKNNAGNDSNGFNWGMNDFQILDANGDRIAFPSDTTVTGENGFHTSSTGANLIDGNIASRCLVWNTSQEKTEKTGYCSWVVIDMKQPTSFSGYRWYTAHGNSADNSRVPVAWTLETSEDGTNWSRVDTAADPYNQSYASGSDGVLRGPYALRGHADGLSSLATIPSGFFAETTARSVRAPALKARYFRFDVHETSGPFSDQNAYGWMVSELELFRNGAHVDWPAGAKPSLDGSSDISWSNGSMLGRFCDNIHTGGTENATLHRVFVLKLPSYVTIDAGEEVTFDAYGFYSAAGGCCDNRIPTSWTLSVSADGQNWVAVDEHARERTVPGYYALQGVWSVADRFPLLRATAATDALGDESPVTVAAGAELGIDSDYERFGALSGSGTVRLCAGAVAEINAFTNASFAGAVSGAGTLAVTGVATQNLDRATLTGVRTLELNGGFVTGTASFGGNDVTLKGGDGALWAELSGIGTLSVSGTPKIVLPADLFAQGGARKTLITASSIPVEAQTAFRNAEIVRPDGLPGSWKAIVSVDGTTVTVSCGAVGTCIIVR